MNVNSEDLLKILTEVNSKGSIKTAISDDDDLFKMGALDSMAVVQFILAIEKKYSIKISKKDINFNSFTTINNIKSLISSKVS